jgi:hypothetical protein
MTAIILRALNLSAQTAPIELFRTDGEISRADTGWTYEDTNSTGTTVFLPFEGHYPNKSGRLQSPVFPLRKNDDRAGFYRLTFTAQCDAACLWWLDYFDANGQGLPDCNSSVYPGSAYRDYDQIVYVPGPARQAQIAFVSKGRVKAGDVRFTTSTAAEAAQWCDTLYKEMPPLTFKAPPDAMRPLPKTAAALKHGTPWRVVMLGDSIVNDSFNSLFQALVKRDFPASAVEFIVSVRGSTGCTWYRQPAEFKKYVADLRPDLLMIGGVSNFMQGNDDEKAALAEVIQMTRAQLNCEIVIMSQPLSSEWRDKAVGGAGWRSLLDHPDLRRCLDYRPAREVAETLKVPFWDLTAPCQDYRATSGSVCLNRDYIHNDDHGKQIIGRVLQAYLQTAK